MRVGFPAGSRLEWYDRNPADASLSYSAESVAPHTRTSRGAYTVPAGKKAFLEAVLSYMIRSAAAGTVGLCYQTVDYTPSGGSGKPFVDVYFSNNTLWYHEQQLMGTCGILRAGDRIEIFTCDVSTGGAVNYYCTIKVTEFSA